MDYTGKSAKTMSLKRGNLSKIVRAGGTCVFDKASPIHKAKVYRTVSLHFTYEINTKLKDIKYISYQTIDF